MPRVRDRAKSPYVPNGFHQASADPDVLRHWASMYPDAIYGLPCAPNGLFVVDADRHGNGDGVANVMALYAQHRFDWRSIPAVQTPADGLHFFFQRPATLGRTKGRLAEAIDVRDNGYVISPGSTLPDGRRYALLFGTVEQLALAIASRSLPMMPDWLIAAALQPSHTPSALRPPTSREGVTRQLSGLVETVVGAPAGSRNRVLFWAACRLGGLICDGVVQSDAALALLSEAGQQSGLGKRESYATALSGLRQGQRDAAHGR